MGYWLRARSVLHCHGVLALRDRPLSGALLAVQEGGRMEGLRLVSRQFRKQRLAVWAAGRGPDQYFTDMVFWLCETVLPHCFSIEMTLQCPGVGGSGRSPLIYIYIYIYMLYSSGTTQNSSVEQKMLQ